MDELKDVTRVTLVDHTTGGEGRVYEKRGIKVLLDIQDQGRTFKVFIVDSDYDGVSSD